MKIRIQGNTVRLRLQQTEMQELEAQGEVIQTTAFPGQEFRYSVSLSDVNEPEAHFSDGHVRVRIPRSALDRWIRSDEVGLENSEYTKQGTGLKILIEKDFQCLHVRRHEDESDAFPNPLSE